MNERPSFVHEDMPLVSRGEPFSFDEFLEQAKGFFEGVFSQITDADAVFPQSMIIGHEGEISVIAWGQMSQEFQDHFLDRVVPTTLESHDVSMVALAVTTYLTHREADATPTGRQEVVLLSILAVSGDEPRELTVAGEIERRRHEPPRLGTFETLGESLAPVYARPLYEGVGSRLGNPD